MSSRDTTRYYEAVVAKLGQVRANRTVEYFQAPGVGHCGGGVGPDRVDLLDAMVGWVERGSPPSRQGLMLTRSTGGPVSRPLCKFPAYPRYLGRGDPGTASSFACTQP